MTATRVAYSKWKSFIRGAETAFLVLFGFFAIFFTATPETSNDREISRGLFAGFFRNTAHAETPSFIGYGVFSYGVFTGDGDGGGGGGGCGDSGGGGCGDSGGGGGGDGDGA